MDKPSPLVAYYRVSTERQGRSGLGLDAQRTAVAAYANGRALLSEFVEIESGCKNNRPQIAAALSLCRQKKAILVIAKLDRLARSVSFISSLMDSSVEFVAVDMPQANRLTLHILSAVAEHERDLISQRTRAALAIARSQGKRLGNPHPDTRKASIAAAHGAANFRLEAMKLIQPLHVEGRSLREIAMVLNERGIKSSRGSIWHAASVRNVISKAPSK